MSEHLDRARPHGTDTESPALSIASLALGVAGALIGYRVNWLAGVVLLLVGIVCGVIALRRRTPLHWAAIAGIIVGAICLIICAAVISIVFYQAQQMNELLSS